MKERTNSTKDGWFHSLGSSKILASSSLLLFILTVIMFAAGAHSDMNAVSPKSRSCFLLSAAARWEKTGIMIPAKGSVRITASGKVQLAAHHIVNAGTKDVRPPFGWVGPAGREYNGNKELLVGKESNIGCLLAALHSPEDATTPEPCILTNPRPQSLSKIGLDGIVYNDADRPMELWLIVNDEFLDPTNNATAKKQYLASSSYLYAKSQGVRGDHWDYIKANKYWDLWYDDNLGHFLVTIEN